MSGLLCLLYILHVATAQENNRVGGGGARKLAFIHFSNILWEQCAHSILFSEGMVSQGKLKFFIPPTGHPLSPERDTCTQACKCLH